MSVIFLALLIVISLVSVLSVSQWFIEVRFQLRKTVKSFEDYGRKRGLLKISPNKAFQIGLFVLALISILVLVVLLLEDFYYHSVLILPVLVVVLGIASNFIHNISFDAISLNLNFLDEEYFKIRDIEDNVINYKQELVLLEDSVNKSQGKSQNFLEEINHYLKKDSEKPQIKDTYNDIKTRITNQFQSIDGSIIKFKDYFTLIAQEFIQTQNKFINKESNSIKFEEIDTFKEHLNQIEEDNIKLIVDYVNKSIKNKQLNQFSDYPKVIRLLNEMNYQPSVEDMTVILEAYPLDTAADRNAFLNAVYELNFINISFFESLIIPKDIEWFFNPTFYSTFNEADIKKIFFKAIEQESFNIIKRILQSFSPKYTSYLNDLIKLHQVNDTVKELIETHDSFLSRLNQYMNPYNIEENYLNALLNMQLDNVTLDELEKLKSRDLSTPHISKRIGDLYLDSFSKNHQLLILLIELYVSYKKMIKKKSNPPLFNIEVLVQYILERFSLLEFNAAKAGLLFIVFDLLNCHIPWHNDAKYQDLYQNIISNLNLNDDKGLFDKLMVENPKTIFNQFIKTNSFVKELSEVQLHSLLMRIENNRLLINNLI